MSEALNAKAETKHEKGNGLLSKRKAFWLFLRQHSNWVLTDNLNKECQRRITDKCRKHTKKKSSDKTQRIYSLLTTAHKFLINGHKLQLTIKGEAFKDRRGQRQELTLSKCQHSESNVYLIRSLFSMLI